MSNVKLAIRVRPFTDRELRSEKDRVPVVNVVDDNTVTITNIKVNVSGAGDSRERVRRYHADYTFDSSCPSSHVSYASQEKVFESIGREVLCSVSRGSSACVLAYGQSATGKTHTMMGNDAEPGLIPRICRTLIEQQPLELTVSFLEIYNERVHDLLAGESAPAYHSLPRRRGNARKDLRVREHPSRGPYVQNLRRVVVHEVDSLLSLVSEGARRRRTAATRRNSASSRSHALLELATGKATLHLADLAGSEKASWEGCGGGRQKEGANINKSLVALSNVISALVSAGSGRGRFVPYRDSALTWLLKDCFTGGACTFIIATVSPSVSCYGESASTLRWAARAKQLPTPRLVPNGPNTSRAALQAQLNQLLAELTRNHIRYVPETGKIIYDDNHWALQVNCNIYTTSTSNKNIGNIMNNLLHPKGEAHTSESTPSSVASGSSDVINNLDKNTNIANEISKEVDKIFGPALERTKSGDDFKVVAPLRHKRRQYRSQEVLPIDKIFTNQNNNLPDNLPIHNQVTEIPNTDKIKHTSVPILHDNQRAEIVASVTERLYSKLKKKEEAVASKVEAVVDRKIMEPLNELKICTNARQRLIELSQKAIRNKRRIGIPAHTQTRKLVTRVRDQAIDIQTDLESYIIKSMPSYIHRRDVGTETMPMTPRCKDVAVGSKYGSLQFNDSSTTTEQKPVSRKHSFMMTDIVAKCSRCTQTPIVPPPRRKKRPSVFSKYLKNIENIRHFTEETVAAPVISINISQTYPVDSESQDSDNNGGVVSTYTKKPNSVTMTPDLLTNHSTIDAKSEIKSDNFNNTSSVFKELPKENEDMPEVNTISCAETSRIQDEFPDSEDCALPRTTVNSCNVINHGDIKNMILGRSTNIYPYNIVLSPPKERDTARLVKFKEIDAPSGSVASHTTWESEDNGNSSSKCPFSSEVTNSDKDFEGGVNSNTSTCSDSAESSKVETDSFIWKRNEASKIYNNTLGYTKRNYVPVYKTNSSYKTTKGRIYREFLGLDEDTKDNKNGGGIKDFSSSDSISERSRPEFRQRRKLLENNLKRVIDSERDSFESLERKILDSCDDLDLCASKYDRYFSKHLNNSPRNKDNEVKVRKPKEYLQHLVQLRREVVRGASDSSIETIRK